jgi:DNA-binding GntR family transcriptional regulator
MKRAVESIDIPPMDEENESPKTLSEAVYRRLRQDILWGNLPPGSPLRSDELKRTYDVGISPLREALSRLVSERLVTLSGQRGFRVAPLTVEDVLDTMETRIVLECEALTRSIHSGSLAWETGIVSSFHSLSRIELPRGPGEQAEIWAKHHRDSHMAFLAGCGSRWMMLLARSLFDHAERHRILALHEEHESRDATEEHRRIMEAALARNAKAAVGALDYHYRTTAEFVVKCISAREESSSRKVVRRQNN